MLSLSEQENTRYYRTYECSDVFNKIFNALLVVGTDGAKEKRGEREKGWEGRKRGRRDDIRIGITDHDRGIIIRPDPVLHTHFPDLNLQSRSASRKRSSADPSSIRRGSVRMSFHPAKDRALVPAPSPSRCVSPRGEESVYMRARALADTAARNQITVGGEGVNQSADPSAVAAHSFARECRAVARRITRITRPLAEEQQAREGGRREGGVGARNHAKPC